MEHDETVMRPLRRTGWAVIERCGHAWTYVFRMSRALMHDLAALTHATPCPWCRAGAPSQEVIRPPTT